MTRSEINSEFSNLKVAENRIHIPDYLENPEPLPAPDLKNKSGGKGHLGRPEVCLKNIEASGGI